MSMILLSYKGISSLYFSDQCIHNKLIFLNKRLTMYIYVPYSIVQMLENENKGMDA